LINIGAGLKHVEPVPPEECERLRRQLQLVGPDAADQCALYCHDRAGQLVTCDLYDLASILRPAAYATRQCGWSWFKEVRPTDKQREAAT
jgi:hypothetical protein